MMTVTITTITQICIAFNVVIWLCSVLIKEYYNNTYTIDAWIGDNTMRMLKSECYYDMHNIDTIEFELEPVSIEYKIIKE